VESKDTDTKIKNLVKELNKAGKNIPTIIYEIDGIPFNNYAELTQGLKSGDITILRHSRLMENSLFSAIATSFEKFKLNLGIILMWVGMMVFSILAFLYSWWFLLGVPSSYVLGSLLVTKTYNQTIFRVAVNIESGFCFLYYLHQISIGFPKTQDIYFYNEE